MTKFIFLLSLTITTLATNAQNNSKTEAEIRRLEQIVVTAILKADTNKLKQVWAPEFLVNNPRNDISGNRDSVLLTQKAGISTITRMAGNYGYDTYIVNDATATFNKAGADGQKYSAELIHDTALASLNNEFATVISTQKLIETIGL